MTDATFSVAADFRQMQAALDRAQESYRTLRPLLNANRPWPASHLHGNS